MKNRSKYMALAIAGGIILSATVSHAQFKVNNEFNPTIVRSIGGVTEFEREKYVNISGRVTEWQKALTEEQRRYFIEELEIYTGRVLGMVGTQYKWGKSLREDPNRPGYTDIEYLKSKVKKPEIDSYYRKAYGSSERLAMHDSHNTYPDYMPQYNNIEDGKGKPQLFPENNDAAGEVVAALLKYGYDDFSRPKFYEPVNEPDWRYWKDDRFSEHHLEIKRHVDATGVGVEVGGPCFSVSYFYGRNYQSLKSMTNFIDNTNNSLDFYSFHSYDYLRWDAEKHDFTGSVNSGSALEGVFDAIASHTYNNYGREFKFVGSEHGGYISNGDDRKAVEAYVSEKYFPKAKGFEAEVMKREVSNFVTVSSSIANTLTYMNHPHIVKKSVPFILVETTGWDPRYYASMLVKENFDKSSPNFVVTKLSYFYEFFKGVKGERIYSWCDAIDIQHAAYIDGDKLSMLYHNQSNKSGEITLNLTGYEGKIKSVVIRRVGRDESLRPYLTEEKIKNPSSINIAGQESIALFITFKDDVERSATYIETPHYATEQGVEFKASHNFTLPVKGVEKIEEAFLRVGISRKDGVSEGIKISFNGEELKSELESSADRFTHTSGYVTTRIIKVPKSLIKASNNVEVSFADGGTGGVGAVVLRGMTKQ